MSSNDFYGRVWNIFSYNVCEQDAIEEAIALFDFACVDADPEQIEDYKDTMARFGIHV